MAEAVTAENGKLVFSDNLTVGTLYDIYLNGEKLANKFVKSGATEYVYGTPAVKEKVAGATFTAHVINKDMQNVANQKVDLYDITESDVFYKSMTTDANGNVVFDVPAGRNFAVYVNGVNQGYTLRGVEGSKLENTFFVDTKGDGKYNAETQPATVIVVDENNNPLAGQKVALYRGGVKVAEAVTAENGKLVFSDNLTVGTLYDIYLNGERLPNKFVKSGATEYVYGTPVAKEEPKEESKEKPHEEQKVESKEENKQDPKQEDKKIDSKVDDSKTLAKAMNEVKKKPEAKMMNSSTNQNEMRSEKAVVHQDNKDNEMTVMNKADNKIDTKQMAQQEKQEMKKLPMTGEQQGLLAGLASMLFVAGTGLLIFIRRK
ncbi:LPXTG cell wall anchor domain-containing protein [Macrococcus equipercicus]|uniref:LPXTG cell wall anchor domain-containing protein n=1 Tax=Macrococcus equipercicus TaxID=69967 RepID=A0A9Q9BMJ5_9STAP|nr:LPXTG cell wall anchor domain-containing protein [Macrococcus equipercicus]UTH13880.1 LPXTG cell wall anchor domain-containing protein [Macrococcus equipercicus]